MRASTAPNMRHTSIAQVLLTLVSVVAGAIPPLDAAVNNAYALLIRNPMAVVRAG